jgi:signal transduction histidine kinase
MPEITIPYERLLYFQDKLDLCKDDMEALHPYRDHFISKKREFGRYFLDFFYGIPETRIIIEYERSPGKLEEILSNWFESLFSENLNRTFLDHLWRSGIKHVEVNLDQRYVNLGYAIVRQFCQRIIKSEIPADQKERISQVIDKLLDFCVLITTDSFIFTMSRFDRQMIDGIAHQVRNPITVIGGNIRRLQRKVDKNSLHYRTYEAIIQENQRLERMVIDIEVYTGLFRREPQPGVVFIENLIENSIEELRRRRHVQYVPIEIDLDPRFSSVLGDPKDLATMFYYLLENSFEAADPEDPCIKISTKESSQPHFVRIEIFNNGDFPKYEDVDELFTPFYSSKSTGTGFGLPIAKVAVRKNQGSLLLEPAPGQGTQCIITLPVSDRD